MDSLIAASIHDAKNTLNALNTWLAEAEREHPSAALLKARASAQRVSAQLVELLVLYRAGEGTLRLAVDDHHVGDLVRELFAEVIPVPGQPGIETDLAAIDAIGEWALDAYQVKLVLADALRNALRYGRSRVTLRIDTMPAAGLCFEVRDDSEGYPPDILRGEDLGLTGGGTGLGLRFARLVAERHATPAGKRGRVELRNDGGAVFRLILP